MKLKARKYGADSCEITFNGNTTEPITRPEVSQMMGELIYAMNCLGVEYVDIFYNLINQTLHPFDIQELIEKLQNNTKQ